jgi:hypothetical protein
MKPKTRISSLSDKELFQLVKFVRSYCEMTFGINKRKRKKLNVKLFQRAEESKKICGWYCPFENEITMFIKPNKDVREFCRTFIHEYTHYMQPCRTKYHKLLKEYGYDKHPFEIQAYATERHYGKKCMDILKLTNKIKK